MTESEITVAWVPWSGISSEEVTDAAADLSAVGATVEARQEVGFVDPASLLILAFGTAHLIELVRRMVASWKKSRQCGIVVDARFRPPRILEDCRLARGVVYAIDTDGNLTVLGESGSSPGEISDALITALSGLAK
jgi:hypothetical protein